jgi:chemotaxis protein methyltransferase CheR
VRGAGALEWLKREVVVRTGHHYYVDKDKLLYERARERMLARGLTSFESYVDLLEGGDNEEWRRLEDAITIGETYFFRYPDHFASLRETVLPRLIAARQETRALRIWSIGCSNGAEPYSIAIVLRELLGAAVDDWRISLIGGDISEKALSAARAGRYGAWALRTMPADDRARYFDRDDQTWVLKRPYRAMVRFERQNILALLSGAPPLEWSGFDLILCRNVLIYFSPQQAIEIVDALGDCLASDGALFLGHAEATLTFNSPLKQVGSAPLPTEFAQVASPSVDLAGSYFPPVVPPLPLSLMARQAPANDVVGRQTDGVDLIQQLADAGAYEDAGRLCAQCLRDQPTSARLHYYDAILHQVSDDPVSAEAALRRAIYLDRSFVLAHHRLGMLLLALGRRTEARRSLQTAVRLADVLASTTSLPEGRGVSAGELAAAARVQLIALDAVA